MLHIEESQELLPVSVYVAFFFSLALARVIFHGFPLEEFFQIAVFVLCTGKYKLVLLAPFPKIFGVVWRIQSYEEKAICFRVVVEEKRS